LFFPPVLRPRNTVIKILSSKVVIMTARVLVDLSQEQSIMLIKRTGSGNTKQCLALRAKVILLALEGLSLHNIAAKLD